MYARCLAVVVLAAGCYRPSLEGDCTVRCEQATLACPGDLACGGDGMCHAGEVECSARPHDDAGADSADPIRDSGDCVGTGVLRVCFDTPPPTTLELPPVFDTDTACNQPPLQLDPSTTACVFAAQTLEVSTRVEISGTRPLVLVGRDHLIVHGAAAIEVKPGSTGADPSDCIVIDGIDEIGGAVGPSGGPGGSFGQRGGFGGGGTGGGATTPSSGTITPMTLHGGCPGGRGGHPPANAGPGAGGAGGGAIALVSRDMEIDGPVSANGAGGTGGGGDDSKLGGGGGGGSGGHIVIDAPVLVLGATGKLYAEGGGGGGGGDLLGGDNGHTLSADEFGPAAQGNAQHPETCGNGGAGSLDGSGSPGSVAPGNGTSCGGGGGGGGSGVIQIVPLQQPMTSVKISPSPT